MDFEISLCLLFYVCLQESHTKGDLPMKYFCTILQGMLFGFIWDQDHYAQRKWDFFFYKSSVWAIFVFWEHCVCIPIKTRFRKWDVLKNLTFSVFIPIIFFSVCKYLNKESLRKWKKMHSWNYFFFSVTGLFYPSLCPDIFTLLYFAFLKRSVLWSIREALLLRYAWSDII